ncbi:MAG: gamma-glutamyltransferase [Planctomycetales bacterium]|nr:gamma-glutamyltransferase [Planctomycetales bacterium]
MIGTQSHADRATGQRGAIATVHPIATDAGLKVLQSGGNALDAAIASAVMLGVVDSHNSGLGGGCFILVDRPDGEILAIDGREMAAAAAHRDMYVRDGKVIPELSRTGPLAIGVPGAIAAYDLALQKRGTRQLSELLRPAAEVARNGFPIDRIMAGNIARTAEDINRFPATAGVLLDASGQPWPEGHRLVQTDLAKTYDAIATIGPEWFYQGAFAEQAEAWMRANEGIITKQDFQNYRAVERKPIVTTYRGFTVYGFPPPSSGGIHVAQILNILENFDLKKIHSEDPIAFVHVITEAMKLAFADRAYWLGDADHASVPRGLVDKRYAARLAAKIDLDKSTVVDAHGLPPEWQEDVYGRHTTHIAAADASGMFVAITATVNTSFGSKVMVPGTGLVLNNEMDDFSAMPGIPNAFGLVGAENNSIAPGKRPLSSMSPTIIVKDGTPVMTLGAAGGPKIITQVLLAIIRYIDLESTVQDSVRSARFHHQWRPDVLFVESNMPSLVTQSLQQRGHNVQRLGSAGILQAIIRERNGEQNFTAVSDPRAPGRAAAF